MDLFYNNLTPTQQLKKLNAEAKEQLGVEYNWRSSKGKNAKRSFRLIAGDPKVFNDCILFVLPHVTLTGFFRTKSEKSLVDTLNRYGIIKRIGTYAILSESKNAGRQAVKNSTTILYKLIDIVQPKLIVAMGELASEAFLSKKPKIIDLHGTQITTYNNVPVLYTYPMDYYADKSGYEDADYKNSIYKHDWSFISKRYKEVIDANV